MKQLCKNDLRSLGEKRTGREESAVCIKHCVLMEDSHLERSFRLAFSGKPFAADSLYFALRFYAVHLIETKTVLPIRVDVELLTVRNQIQIADDKPILL